MLWSEPRGVQSSSLRSLLALGLSLSFGLVACAGHKPNANSPRATLEGTAIPIAAVDDAGFAQAAYRVLVADDGSAQRSGLLVGVVRRQLLRAKARFDAGQREAGLNALTGAFYLMRAGEFRSEALDGADGTDGALSAGAAEVSRLGEEGYAFTLYTMLRDKLPQGPERAEVEAHLDAMARFSRATRGAGPMQTASADLRRRSRYVERPHRRPARRHTALID